jgi:hypothetical protein
VFAQLRDVLAAKNSAIVAEKNNNGGLALPQRTQADFLAIGIRENDVSELLAESILHLESSLTSRISLSSPRRRLRFRCLVVGKIRRQLWDDKFLNYIGESASANPNSLVFKHQACAAIFRRVVKV